MVDKTLS